MIDWETTFNALSLNQQTLTEPGRRLEFIGATYDQIYAYGGDVSSAWWSGRLDKFWDLSRAKRAAYGPPRNGTINIEAARARHAHIQDAILMRWRQRVVSAFAAADVVVREAEAAYIARKQAFAASRNPPLPDPGPFFRSTRLFPEVASPFGESVERPATRATITLGGLRLTARDEGVWGNTVRVVVGAASAGPVPSMSNTGTSSTSVRCDGHPTSDYRGVIEITTTGALGVGEYRLSTDDGATFGSPTTIPGGGTISVLGTTVTFNGASFTDGDVFRWHSRGRFRLTISRGTYTEVYDGLCVWPTELAFPANGSGIFGRSQLVQPVESWVSEERPTGDEFMRSGHGLAVTSLLSRLQQAIGGFGSDADMQQRLLAAQASLGAAGSRPAVLAFGHDVRLGFVVIHSGVKNAPESSIPRLTSLDTFAQLEAALTQAITDAKALI